MAVLLADLESGHDRCRWAGGSRSGRTITITVKAMPEGFLSTHLVGGVAPGTIVRLAAPQGNFVMPDPAPAEGAVHHRRLGHHAGDVDAAHAGPPRADHRRRPLAFGANGIRRDVRRGAGRTANAGTTATGCGCGPPAPQGRLDLSRLDDEVPDWRERQTWACGPEGMLDTAERVWSAAGIAEQLHLERFAVSKAGGARAGRHR